MILQRFSKRIETEIDPVNQQNARIVSLFFMILFIAVGIYFTSDKIKHIDDNIDAILDNQDNIKKRQEMILNNVQAINDVQKKIERDQQLLTNRVDYCVKTGKCTK